MKRVPNSSPLSFNTNKLSADSAYVSESPLKRPARWLRCFPALGRHGSAVRAAFSQKACRFRSPIASKWTRSLSLRLHISAANRSIGTVGELMSCDVSFITIGQYSNLAPNRPLSPNQSRQRELFLNSIHADHFCFFLLNT